MQTIHVFYIRQNEKLEDKVFQNLLAQLPGQFQEEIKSYKHWESAQASLLGKIILKHGFAELNLPYSLQDIQIGNKDRPFVPSELDFNISHSGKYVVVAINPKGKVGVDIEKHRKLNIDLFRRYFDDNEWLEIKNSKNTVQTFFDLWTIKESAIKCDGRGVEILSKIHKRYNNKNEVYHENEILNFQSFFLKENYSSAVCSQQDFDTTINEVVFENL